jgi:hypothetical protein
MANEIDPTQRASDVAFDLAMTAIVRRLFGELLYRGDAEKFRTLMRKFEDVVIDDLKTMSVTKSSNEYTDNYVKEAASQFVSRFFASVQPPEN